MPQPKRITVYLDQELHRALKLKGADLDRSVSDLINAAVTRMLKADQDDIESVRLRAREPALAYESVLAELVRRGKLAR